MDESSRCDKDGCENNAGVVCFRCKKVACWEHYHANKWTRRVVTVIAATPPFQYYYYCSDCKKEEARKLEERMEVLVDAFDDLATWRREHD